MPTNEIRPIDLLIAAIKDVGVVSLSDSKAKLPPGQKVFTLSFSGLYFGVPQETSQEQQFEVRDRITRSMEGLEQLDELSRKYVLLKNDHQSIVDITDQQDFEMSLSMNLLMFLGETQQFGVLYNNQQIVANNLGKHTVEIAKLQLKAKPEYSVRVSTGELFTFQYENYIVIVERETPLSITEKNHIKLTIKYISLQRTQKTINEAMQLLIEENEEHNKHLEQGSDYNLQNCLDNLVKDALVDPLTQAYNRRYAVQYAEKLYSQQTPFSVVIIDVDHFKAVNDTYGHDVGDKVLCELVELFKQARDNNQVVARWGGEEFLILLEETGLEQTVEFAQSLRKSVEAHTFTTGASLTASFGVAQSQNAERNLRSLVKQADRALYRAKENGRNRVEYSPRKFD